MSLRAKTAQGLLWSGLQAWGGKAVSLVVFFFLARLLTPEAFGLMALAVTVIAFIQLFVDQGLTQALIQREKLEPEHIDTAFWTNFAFGSTLTVVGIIGAGKLATLLGQPQLTPILQALSFLCLIASVSSVPEALLAREFDFKTIAMRSFLGLGLSAVLGVSMAWFGFGVWSLVGQQLTYELVGAIVLWRASTWRPQARFSPVHFGQLFRFGLSLFLLNLVNFAKDESNGLLIGYFLNPLVLGFYTVAEQVAESIMYMVVTASSQIALPMFSRLQNDLERFRRVFYQATELTACVAMPTFLGIAVMAPEVVRLALGPQWDRSVPVLQILAVASVIDSVAFFRGHILTAMGRPSWRLWQALLSSVLHLAAFAIAYRWGIVAVAWAYFARRAVMLPVGQWTVHLLIHFSWRRYLRQFVAPTVASLSMVATVHAFKSVLYAWDWSPIPLTAACIAVGIGTYGVLIRLLAPALYRQLFDLARAVVTPGEVSTSPTR